MKFSELCVGRWFIFEQSYSGMAQGPFKKTGNRTYLYHHHCGWYETRIGKASLPVLSAERPEYAPDEMVDVLLHWEPECHAYYATTLAYPLTEGEADQEKYSDFDACKGWQAESASERNRQKAKAKAIATAREFALELVSTQTYQGIRAEKVVVFLEGNEYFVARHENGKGRISFGVAHPRHPLNCGKVKG